MKYLLNDFIIEEHVKSALAEDRAQLTTLESIDVLQAYGIRACKYGLATNEEEVKEAVDFPAAMKVAPPKALVLAMVIAPPANASGTIIPVA